MRALRRCLAESAVLGLMVGPNGPGRDGLVGTFGSGGTGRRPVDGDAMRARLAVVVVVAAAGLLVACGGTASDTTSGTTEQTLDADAPPEGFEYENLSGEPVTIYGDRVVVHGPQFDVEFSGTTEFDGDIPHLLATMDQGCEPDQFGDSLETEYDDWYDIATLAAISDPATHNAVESSVVARYLLDQALEAGCDFAEAEDARLQLPGAGWSEPTPRPSSP